MQRHCQRGLDRLAVQRGRLVLPLLDGGSRGVECAAVVKADAYGHGAIYCARALEQAGADWFGVALPEEGGKLRDSGINKPILCLGGFWPGQEELLVSKRLTPVVYSTEQLEALSRVAQQNHLTLDYHLKVDTGMGRLGIRHEEAPAFFRELKGLKNLELEGIFSHFASADELDDDGSGYTARQTEIFAAVLQEGTRQGFSPTFVHIANSAAAFSRDFPFCNLARPGIVLYGALAALPAAIFSVWHNISGSAIAWWWRRHTR